MTSAMDPEVLSRSVVNTALVVVSVIFPLLSLLCVILRLVARRRSSQPIQSDDYWTIAAWLFTLGVSINAWVFGGLMGINHYKVPIPKGLSYSAEVSKHGGTFLTGTADVNQTQCIQVSSILLVVALTTVKISILLFYRRFFSTKTFNIASWTLVAVVSIWGIIFFFIFIFISDPIDAGWTGIGRQRFDTTAVGLAQSGSSIALDFIVLALPLPAILNLHMKPSKKIALVAIFWLGAFCCVAAIARLALLRQSLEAAVEDLDTVGNESNQYIFQVLEPNCSVIAACLPCMAPLFVGGRAAESLVASVRSIFSLRSLGSGRNSGGSHGTRRDRRQAQRVLSQVDEPAGDGSRKESGPETVDASNDIGAEHASEPV